MDTILVILSCVIHVSLVNVFLLKTYKKKSGDKQ